MKLSVLGPILGILHLSFAVRVTPLLLFIAISYFALRGRNVLPMTKARFRNGRNARMIARKHQRNTLKLKPLKKPLKPKKVLVLLPILETVSPIKP